MLPAEQPTLTTPRLALRPFTLADAPAVVSLAGDWAIATMTLSIPHPYGLSQAQDWIQRHPRQWTEGKALNYAIILPNGPLLGGVGLSLHLEHHLAELGYWVGQPFWGHGYATEAARALLAFGFGSLGLNRINATRFGDNPASGRVMEKLGMTCEGHRRRHTLKEGVYRDIKLYGLLREDWLAAGGGERE